MVRHFSAFVMSLFLGIVPTQAQEMAERIPSPEGFSSEDGACFFIDARREWQRVDLSTWDRPSYFFVDPRNTTDAFRSSLSVPYRWSVDDRNYERVNSMGHRGEDAEALAQFQQYRYSNYSEFGRALLRSPAYEGVYSMARSAQVMIARTSESYLDIRINDTSLGDNGGGLVFCIKSRDYRGPEGVER